MTIKELIAKLDECRAALEDDLIPEAEEADEADEDDQRLADFNDALANIEIAISNLEDHK